MIRFALVKNNVVMNIKVAKDVDSIVLSEGEEAYEIEHRSTVKRGDKFEGFWFRIAKGLRIKKQARRLK